MKPAENRHFLDSAGARIAALGCFALAASALVYVHRDDLFPAEPTATTMKDDPFARCFRDATATIDKMLAEKTIDAAQATLFRTRAEARCRDQAGDSGGPPGTPPGLPPAR